MASYNSSVSVDKNGVDQSISGTDATTVTAAEILWDFNNDFDLTTSTFVSPATGIFDFDMQIGIGSLTNVTAVEAAVFRVGTGPGGADEYWFNVGKQYINIVDTDVHLSAYTRFNMVQGEVYAVKVILYGSSPSATIVGDTTQTAWDFSFICDMTGH